MATMMTMGMVATPDKNGKRYDIINFLMVSFTGIAVNI